MAEPDWKTEVQSWIEAWIGGSLATQETALRSLSLYLDEAYQRGLMAGRSQAGYRRNKNGGGVCPTCLSALIAGESDAPAGDP